MLPLKLAVTTPKTLNQEPDAGVSPHVHVVPKDPSCLFIVFPGQQH